VPQFARNRGGDRHRELEQVVEAEPLRAQALGSDRGPERLVEWDLIGESRVGLHHDAGEHPGESARILTVLGEGVACVVQRAQCLDGSRLRSLNVNVVHLSTPDFIEGLIP